MTALSINRQRKNQINKEKDE